MNKSHGELLKEYGISPSYTRIEIYNYLECNKSHPSVDMIFQKLSKKLPTLSKTTVYNILKLFIDKQVVKEVTIGSLESRYELLLKEHSHFKCEVCNKLVDIPLVNTIVDDESLRGFDIKERVVLFKGICPTCQNKH